MTKVPQKRTAFYKEPVFVIASSIVIIVVATIAVRALRPTAGTSLTPSSRPSSRVQIVRDADTIAGDRREQEIAAAQALHEREQRQRDLQQQSQQVAAKAQAPANQIAASPDAQPAALTPGSADAASLSGTAASAPTAATAPQAATNPTTASESPDTPGAGLSVTFAWAEVSHAWLESMGALQPGAYRVMDLEPQLRAASADYRVVDMTKKNMSPQSGAIELTRADRAQITLTPQPAAAVAAPAPAAPAGTSPGTTAAAPTAPVPPPQPVTAVSAQLEVRNRIGSANYNVTLERGAGYIITTSPRTTAPSEIVLLILPR